MNLRKHITAFLVLQMFAVQLLLAQHYTVHFNEEQHIAASQQHPSNHVPAGHGKADTDEICQICFFKTFSHTINAASEYVPVTVVAAESITRVLLHALAQNTTLVYSARGPPSLLS